MGKKIVFPFNNKMYLKQARKYIEGDNYEQALVYIQKIYATEKTYAMNYFYVSTLFFLKRYKEALELAEEYKSSYLKGKENIYIYLLLLIKNQQFLKAELLIQKKEPLAFHKQEWQNIQKELQHERELFQIELDLKRKETKNKLLQIEQYSLMEQVELIESSDLLKLEDLQEIAEQVLNHPDIPGQIQRAFLEVLIKKGDEKNYILSWFNQIKKVSPKDLKLFHELPILQEIYSLLEDKLEKTPSLFHLIKNEIIKDLLIIYPFIEETITDTSYWVDLYIAYFKELTSLNSKRTSINFEKKHLNQWFEQLNQIAQRNG